MNVIRIREMTKREILIEFLNFKAYNLSTITTKRIIEEFERSRGEHIPKSSAYRIVKKWGDEQRKMKEQALSTRVSDNLIEIFDD